jgi:hypothetical protein
MKTGVQLSPPFVLIEMLPKMPAYSFDGVAGSIANVLTEEIGLGIQVKPPSMLLKT